MKLLKFILIIFFLFPAITNAKPQVHFDYKIYYTPSNKAYVETLLEFSSPSLKYLVNENGNLVSSLEITQIFRFGDSIIYFDKYVINSPEMLDSTIEDYYDLKRISLEPGYYDFEIIIKDLNNESEVSAEQIIEVLKFNDSKIGFSTLGFIQSANKTSETNDFVKNGFFMLPYLTNYFPPLYNKIGTYFEIYNTEKLVGQSKKVMLTFEVEQFETKTKMDGIFKFQKFNTAKVIPVISFMNIDNLPSGDYNLVVTVINSNNEILKIEKLFFQRRSNKIKENQLSIENLDIANSFTNDIIRDSIPYYLNSLMPISPRFEYESILSLLKTTDTLAMQRYFHAFWVQTKPENPFEGWKKYRAQVEYTQRLFGTQIKKGFETDRGRVHLKYGAPNTIMDRPSEPSAYPYQIWQYYRIGQRSNVRFVFYNPDLVTNDYPLLHSEMQGELQNYRWQHDLHKRNSPNTNLDNPNDGNRNHYGGNSSIYYRN